MEARVEIDWSKSNPDNVALVVAEYEKRLAAGQSLYLELEAKARWLLTVTIPLGSLLAGYVFVSGLGDWCQGIAAIVLAGLLLGSSILAGMALVTRAYGTGAMLPDVSIDQWKTMIEGSESHAKKFAGMRLGVIAKTIETNSQSNRAKSGWVKRAVWLGCLAAPAAGLAFAACHVLLLVFIPASGCPAIVG